MRLSVLSVGILALALHATSARADLIIVSYGLSGTTAAAGLGQIGTVTGSMDIAYQASGGVFGGSTGNVLHGPAQIVGAGSLGGPIGFNVFGAAVNGNASGPLGGAGVGALTSGLGDLLLPFSANLAGTIHCQSPTGAPTLCTAVLSLPSSVIVPFTLPLLGQLTAPGVGAISGTIPTVLNFLQANVGNLGGQTVFATITATEISRTYVPEPSSLPLLGMGLLAIGVGARRLSAGRRR